MGGWWSITVGEGWVIESRVGQEAIEYLKVSECLPDSVEEKILDDGI